MIKSKLIRKNHNKKKVLIITFLVLLMVIGIGYANLDSNLEIVGDITVNKYQNPIIKPTSSSDKTAFRSDTYREKIKIVNLSDEINPPSGVIESWDIGVAQNGNVMAYLTNSTKYSGKYDLYIQGNGHLYAPENSSFLFYDLFFYRSFCYFDFIFLN